MLKIDFENQILALFDVYFWPFNKSYEKINIIFVISAIIASIWNVFIKFRWHDEKLTAGASKMNAWNLRSTVKNAAAALSFAWSQGHGRALHFASAFITQYKAGWAIPLCPDFQNMGLTLFLSAMGRISPYMSVTWPQSVGIGLNDNYIPIVYPFFWNILKISMKGLCQ